MQTIAFWLMDSAMYDFMAMPGTGPQSPIVDRGLALHKMIRLLTLTLGWVHLRKSLHSGWMLVFLSGLGEGVLIGGLIIVADWSEG